MNMKKRPVRWKHSAAQDAFVFVGNLFDVRVAVFEQLFIRPTFGADAAPVFPSGSFGLGEGAGVCGCSLKGAALRVDMVFGAGLAPEDNLLFTGRGSGLCIGAAGTGALSRECTRCSTVCTESHFPGRMWMILSVWDL